ncbi:MAG TPA: NUDIX domain-containing protein, partial [Ignavibacteria bacterium]
MFVKRADNVVAGGFWCPVSGRIENGETQQNAVIREALEEVGLNVKPIKKVWECEAEHGGYLLHWWTVD